MQSYNTLYSVGQHVNGISGNSLLISGIIEKIVISCYMTEYHIRDDKDNKLYKIQEDNIIYPEESIDELKSD